MIREIAWLTPWNARSAIAEYSTNIVSELQRRGHNVTIYRTEAGGAQALEALPYADDIESLATANPSSFRGQFDWIAGCVGDNQLFHGLLPSFMEQVPILAIFHDAFIANLAGGWSNASNSLNVSPRILAQATYSGSMSEEEPYWLPSTEMAERRPMVEWLAGMAAGSVVHSTYWADRLRKATPGHVTTHPLTMPDHAMPEPPAWSGRLTVATIGHVNPNKRADQILAAIASHPLLRARCEYRLLGHVEDAERVRLSRMARSLGLAVPTFTGWIEIDELRRQVAEVHVISCLRHPIFETGSASLILAMRSGRPVLVSDEGVYADVDDDAVLKCRPGNEAPDIARHLLSLIRHPAQRQEVARNALAYVERANSLTSYVDALEDAMERAAANAPAVALYRSFGKSLGSMGVSKDSPACDRILRGLDGMFAASTPPSLAD